MQNEKYLLKLTLSTERNHNLDVPYLLESLEKAMDLVQDRELEQL